MHILDILHGCMGRRSQYTSKSYTNGLAEKIDYIYMTYHRKEIHKVIFPMKKNCRYHPSFRREFLPNHSDNIYANINRINLHK